jgi:hypothetical protein
MGFLRWFEDKFTGDLKAEYGPLSHDAQGLPVSASLRQRRNGKHYLVFKWVGPATLHWVDIEVNPTFLDRMADILKDAKTRVGTA